MNIAIVGGGFYGCYFAYKILQLNKNHKVTIYEKNSSVLSEAAINNQYRLHKGFHYPRSRETIRQTSIGFKLFIKEFKNFLYKPKQNIYAIHKNSKINFQKYIEICKKNNLKFKTINKKKYKHFFTHPDNIEGAIIVDEAVIKLEKLYKFLKLKIKKVKIINNSEIKSISGKGKFLIHNNKKIHFDLIINSTFINPNLGLNKKIYKIKYEIASMLHIKNYLNKHIAITIMDGNFCSVYPINNTLLTLSSVKYTPFKKFKTLSSYLKFLSSRNFLKKLKKHSEIIINDVSKYILMPKSIKIKKITFSPKVKVVNDFNDQRLSLVRIEGKFVSILCGKLDAVFLSWDKIRSKFF